MIRELGMPIAAGNEAELFAWDGGRVLKLSRRVGDPTQAEREASILSSPAPPLTEIRSMASAWVTSILAARPRIETPSAVSVRNIRSRPAPPFTPTRSAAPSFPRSISTCRTSVSLRSPMVKLLLSAAARHVSADLAFLDDVESGLTSLLSDARERPAGAYSASEQAA